MSSGSTSIRIIVALSTSHLVGQQSLRDVEERKIYVDCGWDVSSKSGGDFLPSASLQNGDLLGSMPQGGQEMVER
jgi:hypothetical protein